ncbi:MAG: hypothetical protein ACXVAY_22335 [Mucilaginibacter sp.]
MRILITAATSAKAQKAKIELKDDDILMGDHLELPSFMVEKGSMLNLPKPTDVAYAHKMLTLCLDHGIEMVYLFREREIALLTEAAQLFNEYGLKINANGKEIQ